MSPVHYRYAPFQGATNSGIGVRRSLKTVKNGDPRLFGVGPANSRAAVTPFPALKWKRRYRIQVLIADENWR
jgi:hypothetical protein